MMRRTLALLALLLPLSVSAGEHRAAVMDLLNAVEQPPTQDDLSAVGDTVQAELIEIADDSEVPSSRRGRAISALGHFPDPTVRTFLEARLTQADKSLYRRKAAGALALGWGAEAVPALQTALGDDDAQLRIAVVQSLAQIEDASARAALEARLTEEPEGAVKDAITKALKQEVAQ